MCWLGRCTRKIAKRDITVYKLGFISENNFISLYLNYTYEIKKINKEIKLKPDMFYEYGLENKGAIYKGYHSYTDISMPYSCLGLISRTIYLGKLPFTILLNNNHYVAAFIIPKGSEYYENSKGEIVSSNIIYTGKYVKIGTFEE